MARPDAVQGHRIGGCNGRTCRAQRSFPSEGVDRGVCIHVAVLRATGGLIFDELVWWRAGWRA
jgi:hypothetical protein